MLEITCESCATVGKISLVQEVYEGPYRCWKCRGTFVIRIDNNRLVDCEPISEAEFEQLIDDSKD